MSEVVDQAWKCALSDLKAAGWKVVPLSGREAYYTTLSGRVGTLSLGEVFGTKGESLRWFVDHFSVRKRGRNEMIHPERKQSNSGELSFDRSEVAQVSAWIPAWLNAYESGAPFPLPPVRLTAERWEGGYLWSVLGKQNCPLP